MYLNNNLLKYEIEKTSHYESKIMIFFPNSSLFGAPLYKIISKLKRIFIKI